MQPRLVYRSLGTSIIPRAGGRPRTPRNRADAQPAADAAPVSLWLVVPMVVAASLFGWAVVISAAFGVVRAINYL